MDIGFRDKEKEHMEVNIQTLLRMIINNILYNGGDNE